MSEIKIRAARNRLWAMGDLSWKLDAGQKMMVEHIRHEDSGKVITCAMSRRGGKSFTLALMAIEECLKLPNRIVMILQPTQKMIRVNIKPIMTKILEDCPENLKPQFKTQDNIYVFPNGSEIRLAGTDNGNADNLRGSDAHMCIVDEAAFCSDLKYVVNNVLSPSTMLTDGKIVLSSTPPKNQAHDFAQYMEYAQIRNSLFVLTIHQIIELHKTEPIPRITERMLAGIIAAIPGGTASDTFKQEYECKLISDSDLSIVPEFTEKVQKEIISEWPMPNFCDKYVAMDIGFKDMTVVLFGFYDFQNAVLVIQDEISINGAKMTTEHLAKLIKDKEAELWTNHATGEKEDPYIRVSDNNLIVLNDLDRLHQIYFQPTRKDNKEAAINAMRIEIQAQRIIINPKCETLIHHLERGVWTKNRKDFARSVDGSHSDGIDCITYLVRNIDKSHNPLPNGFEYSKLGGIGSSFSRRDYKSKVNEEHNVFKKVLGIKKKPSRRN